MDFYEVLDQVTKLLKSRSRLAYRALKRQFDLNDDDIEALKDELIYAQQVAIDEDNRILAWAGRTETQKAPDTDDVTGASGTEDSVSVTDNLKSFSSLSTTAERRQLTVMFCDLVDSTRLSNRLDPEDLRDIIKAYQSTCTTVITNYDGHIAQYLGDGLLVYFGYPQAHEDDPQRAVHTGLGIMDSLKNLNARLKADRGIQVSVRIGIHTGLVVIGEMGGGGRQEQLALGETPNIAARLQGLAAPDTLIVSDAAYKLVQGFFDCDSLGDHDLKGVAERVPVYRVLSPSGARSRLDIVEARGLTTLVGRESESTLLFERWERAQHGNGQAILLNGEAGIGKSRLVQVLKNHVSDVPYIRLECRCSPYHQNTSLYPLTDLLQRVLHWQDLPTLDSQLEVLEEMLGPFRMPLHETVPLIAALLSLSLPAHRYPPLELSSQQQRQKTLELLVTLMVEQAEHQPLIFIVEDLHWSDATTTELIGLLIDQVPTAPIFVLLTCRPPFESIWGHRSYLTEITVGHLSCEQIEQMATQVAGGKTLPTEIITQLVDRTDGVPLYVEEVTKALLQSGMLKDTTDRYDLVGEVSALSIPATLQDSLMSRLDRLMTAKVIAQLGATIGRQFSYELLQAVSQLDDATLQRELGRLIEAELIYQRGLPPHSTYTFKHALIQDAAYQALLKSTRLQYHQQLVLILEDRFQPIVKAQPELIAHHALEGEMWDKAVAYLRQAGTDAMGRSAHREAMMCLDQALDAIGHLPGCRDTMEQKVSLYLALRSALQPLGELERLHLVLLKAEALAKALDDRPRQGQIYSHMSNYFWWAGKLERSADYGERALNVATESGDLILQANMRFQLGLAYHAMGDYISSIALHREAIKVITGDLVYKHFFANNLSSVTSRTMLAWALAESGKFAEGMMHGEEGVRIAETAGHQGSLMRVCFGVGQLYLRQGALPQAIAMLERSVSICQLAETPLWFPLVASHLGYAYALSERLDDGLRLLEEATEQSALNQYMGYRTLQLTYLSETYLKSSRVEEANTQAQQALNFAELCKARGDQAHVLHTLGNIAMHRNPAALNEAKTYYDQALTLANELGMRPLQAHCHRGLGALYHRSGQSELARDELTMAIQMYRDMDMTFWLPEVETARGVLSN